MDHNTNFTAEQQSVLYEIFSADETVSYVAVCKKIAEQEERLNSTNGWFWRQEKLSVIDQAEARAQLRLLRGIAKQIENTLFDETGELKVRVDIDIKR